MGCRTTATRHQNTAPPTSSESKECWGTIREWTDRARNVIASVIAIQQITCLISPRTENIICPDYTERRRFPLHSNWAAWHFGWSKDRQMDGQKRQRVGGEPATTWFKLRWVGKNDWKIKKKKEKKKKIWSCCSGGLNTSAQHVGTEEEACIPHTHTNTHTYTHTFWRWREWLECKSSAEYTVWSAAAAEVGLHIMKLKRLGCCNIPGVYS